MDTKVKHVSPECITHSHYSCKVTQFGVKCECLCHKLVGEWKTLIMEK